MTTNSNSPTLLVTEDTDVHALSPRAGVVIVNDMTGQTHYDVPVSEGQSIYDAVLSWLPDAESGSIAVTVGDDELADAIHVSARKGVQS